MTEVGRKTMSLKEQLTPHKVSLLVLIKEFSILKQRIRTPIETVPEGPIMVVSDALESSDEMKSPGTPEQPVSDPNSPSYIGVPVMDESQMTGFMITFLNLIQSRDLPPAELTARLKTCCAPEFYGVYVSKLSEIDEGLQSLMNFFQTLTQDFFTQMNPLAQKTSVVGLFVRRLALCFDALSFSQVTSLFTAFKSYYQAFKAANAENLNLDDSMDASMDCTGDITIPELETTRLKSKTRQYSTRQAELFILQQSNLLQFNPNKALGPAELQNRLDELISGNPGLADVHYLSYLNHLRVNEYCGAVRSLYHYFDRNQFQKKDDKDEDVLTKGYRYAILNLAALHFRFGHREEALLALEEAMRVAHEYNDQVCLQHVLSWFNRLGVDMPLKSLAAEKPTSAAEPRVPYLSSLNVQVTTKRLAVQGDSPALVFDKLIDSDLVNCQHDLTDLSQLSLAQKSALWSLYGNRVLPSLYSQSVLNLYRFESGVEVCGEPGCIAMCTLAQAYGSTGQFSSGFSILNACRRLYPEGSPHSSIWRITEQILLFDQAFHQSHFNKMKDIVQRIESMDTIEGRFRRALYLKEIGDTEKSQEIISELHHQDLSEHPAMFCRVVLLYTELCCQIGNPVGAVDSLVSCLVQCRDRHLMYYESLTSMYLAYVQFCLSLPDQALRIIEENLVTILNLGCNYDKARCLYLYARCRVAAASDPAMTSDPATTSDPAMTSDPAQVTSDPATKKDVMLSVRGHLNSAAALFQSTDNFRRLKDVFYYHARLCHELGFISERNKFAIEFKKLDLSYPTTTQMTVNLL